MKHLVSTRITSLNQRHFFVPLLLTLALSLTLGLSVSASSTSIAGAPFLKANTNSMGINLTALQDSEIDRLFADAIKHSRVMLKTGGSGEPVALDEEGWPVADFILPVWINNSKMHGTYSLSFSGQAVVSANNQSVALEYNSGTNTSTGKFAITEQGPDSLLLKFSSTRRTSLSEKNTGVKSIKLMRPIEPGSNISYSESTLFTSHIKSLIDKFSVIRFMQYSSMNNSQQSNWSDRALPSAVSFSRKFSDDLIIGKGGSWVGGSWEHVIQLMNETGKDGWINIPALATDDYILKVAQLVAFGSDGVNPYTSPQPNPAYPPLNSNLKLYIEYSNETWDGIFDQKFQVAELASNELLATNGASPLNWDGTWNGVAYIPGGDNTQWNWFMVARYTNKRCVEISNIFRSVFGNAAMMARIRPLLVSRSRFPASTLSEFTTMMFEYYNNMSGKLKGTPRPPNYYFYGAGGAAYYNPAKTVSTLDEFFSDPGFITGADFAGFLRSDIILVAAMGLNRVAYEGGPNMARVVGSYPRNQISPLAIKDERMTQRMIEMHNEWSAYGGDLLMYHVSTGDYRWGFTDDIYNLSTRKLAAIDALNTMKRAPLTIGALAPASVAGNMPDSCSNTAGDCLTDDLNFLGPIKWNSYLFRSNSTKSWQVNLSISNAINAKVEVYVDGKLTSSQSSLGGALTVNIGAKRGGLHSILVRAAEGSFKVDTVAVGLL